MRNYSINKLSRPLPYFINAILEMITTETIEYSTDGKNILSY